MSSRIVALSIAAGAFAATFALWRIEPRAFPHAWLGAFITWMGVPLGCMGLLLIHALTGGRWGYAIRPQLRAAARTVIFLPAFSLPLFPSARMLYPWLTQGAERPGNGFYLNESAAVSRALCYLLVWLGLGWLVSRRLRPSDPDGGLAVIAPAGLVILALTLTFASIDLIMSIDPAFSSSVFGLVKIADMALLALSLMIFAVADYAAGRDLHQISRLLLVALLIWAYLSFMELLIVWQSNLPREAAWYGPRLSGGWGALAATFTGLRFVLPFILLITCGSHISRRVVKVISVALILGACGANLWLVGPQSDARPFMLVLTYISALCGVCAASMALTGYRSMPRERLPA